jgi:hypothetical protein
LQGDFAKSVDNMMAQAVEKEKANEAAGELSSMADELQRLVSSINAA